MCLCLPSLPDVDDVHAVWASLPEVRLHVDLHVLAADVALGGQQHLNVLGGRIEDGGKVGGRHLRGIVWWKKESADA